jgi:predicted nuclease with TOPRIM domain
MLSKTDVSKIREAVQDEINPIRAGIKTLKTDVAQIRKDIKRIISFFDSEYLQLRKRVERIEEHLNLPPAS